MNRTKRRQPVPTHSLMDELLASPTEPMAQSMRLHQLTCMWQALRNLETAATPSVDDWRVLSDSVNLLETLVVMGEVQDGSGLLHDATKALHLAGKRHQRGGPIRLDGAGMHAVRSVLQDYAEVIEQLPARTMVRCHRQTEKRIREIAAGKSQPHDVAVMAL